LFLTREIIIISTSNFLGNFLWTIFLKLFLHELIYELIDSIDLIWCIRHWYTHSVIKKLVLTREIIIIATSNFLRNFLWTIFLKLFLHELIYELIDSIDLIWCIRHWFTHSVIKKIGFNKRNNYYSNFKLPGKYSTNHFYKTISSWIYLWI
jgi:hypothetical protein